ARQHARARPADEQRDGAWSRTNAGSRRRTTGAGATAGHAAGTAFAERVAVAGCAGRAPTAHGEAGAAARRKWTPPAKRRFARRRAQESAALRAERSIREFTGRRRVRPGDSVRYQGRGVRTVDSPLRGAGQTQLV